MLNRCSRSAKPSLLLTFAGVVLSSLSLGAIPFLSKVGEESGTADKTIALIFWGGLILSLVASFCTKIRLSKYYKKLILKDCIKQNHLPGIFSFSKNLQMLIVYAVTAIGAILMITDMIFEYISSYIMFPIISITLLSFGVHCILDGKYYKVYKFIKENINNDKQQ